MTEGSLSKETGNDAPPEKPERDNDKVHANPQSDTHSSSVAAELRATTETESDRSIAKWTKVGVIANIGLGILTLGTLIFTLWLFATQNKKIQDGNDLIQESNARTDSALALTRLQIASDSAHAASLDRPWIYLESRSVKKLGNGRQAIVMRFMNTGKTAAYNLTLRYCLEMTYSEMKAFNGCPVGWTIMKDLILPPQGYLELPYNYPTPRSREVNGIPQDQRVYVYGTGTYDKKTDSEAGFVDFCFEFSPILEDFYGCRYKVGAVR